MAVLFFVKAILTLFVRVLEEALQKESNLRHIFSTTHEAVRY